MDGLVSGLNQVVWSNGLLFLCFGAGIYFTIVLRFVQIRYIKEMFRLLWQSSESERGVSSFQALALSVSGRVGTGNIAGVATAIAYGGPGAVFWMWLIAFLGAASAFVESVLGQMYKVEDSGELRGGPAYFIDRAMGSKPYAAVFALVTVVATGFLLPGVQSNSIAVGLNGALDIPVAVTAGGLVIALGLIIFGGVKRIAHVAQFVVPFMALAYIIMAMAVLVANYELLDDVMKLIITSAFGQHQVMGGIAGAALSWGVKRGVFSSEAGQGTGPHAAAAAEVSHPVKQGLVQAFSIYIDTLFVCTATAFMILVTQSYNVIGAEGQLLVDNIGSIEVGPMYTQIAISSLFGGFGGPFVALALLFFAFTTLMAYYYIAETNVAYLSRHIDHKLAINALRVGILLAVMYGCLNSAKVAWALGDLGVGVMAWLNLVAILILHPKVLLCFRDYERQYRAGKDPVFDGSKFGVDDKVWSHRDEAVLKEPLPGTV